MFLSKMFHKKTPENPAALAESEKATTEKNEEKDAEQHSAPQPSPPSPAMGKDPDLLAYKERYEKAPERIPDGADDIEIEGIPKILDKGFYPKGYPQNKKDHTCRFWEISFQNCGEKGEVLEESYYYKKAGPDREDALYGLYELLKSIFNDCPRVTHKGREAGGDIATGTGGVTEYYQTEDGNFFELWYDYDECWGDSVKFCTRTDALGRLMLRELRSIFEEYLGVPLQILIQPENNYWWWREVTITKAEPQPKES